MKLNRMQASTLRRLTNHIQRYCMPDEVMSYRVEKSKYGDLILTASNLGSPWYATHKHATIFVGPRGGVDRKFSYVEAISDSVLKH